jgi:uncharacterized protein (TIGR03000 family)
MYSVVLMAALASGGSAPDCWGHHGHGGQGYYGGSVSATCTGCYGGSYYGMPYGPGWCGGSYGCYGGSWGWGGGVDYNCFGCHGCYGCAGAVGCAGYNPYAPVPNAPEQIQPPKVEEKKGGTGWVAPDRARVIVQLPADARLYVDDQPIRATSENQAFNTPRLERGQTYYYEVRAEAVRGGKTVVESKRVLVRAGQAVTVSFPKLGTDPDGIAAADVKRGR